MVRSVLWLLLALLLNTDFTPAARGDDNCDPSKLPAAVQQVLKQKFPSLHYETLDDLNSEHRDAWLKSQPSGCPGFAVGEFRKRGELSYAFLLVPPDPKKGFKLVVLSKGSSGYSVKVLFEINIEYHFDVISKLPAGEYKDAEGKRKVQVRTDGIQLETMDVGARVFYWEVDRYRSLVISD